jgi:sec-independent protein translocase protein TatA
LLVGEHHRLSCGVVVGDILQPTHLLFVLVIALLVLGPKRLPEVGRSLGRGLRDFRNALSGEDHHEPTISQASTQPDESATAEPFSTATADPAAPTAPSPDVNASHEPAVPVGATASAHADTGTERTEPQGSAVSPHDS